jgi:hypothetical protein
MADAKGSGVDCVNDVPNGIIKSQSIPDPLTLQANLFTNRRAGLDDT